MRDITLSNCHLPDEYIDPAISFDGETSEIQVLPSAKDILTSIVPFHWLQVNKDKTEKTSHSMNMLNECHLPEEYVDVPVLCYFDDGSDMSESEQLPSAKDLLSYVLPIRWFGDNGDASTQSPEDSSGVSDLTLNDYHLPDEYVDGLVSYNSSGREESSPVEDVIRSIAAFPWLGNNDHFTEMSHHAANDIMLNDCHLPDEYVDAVLSSYGTRPRHERNKNPSAKNLKTKCEETESSEPSRSLDHFMNNLNKIISAESSRNIKHPWVADKSSHGKKDDSCEFALKKESSIGSGKDPVEALVPSANVSRGALRRRRPTHSGSGSIQ